MTSSCFNDIIIFTKFACSHLYVAALFQKLILMQNLGTILDYEHYNVKLKVFMLVKDNYSNCMMRLNLSVFRVKEISGYLVF